MMSNEQKLEMALVGTYGVGLADIYSDAKKSSKDEDKE